MIMAVDGELPRERHTQPGPLSGLCRRCAVECPIQTAPPRQDNQHTTSSTLPGKRSDHHS
jgi:hypothetical protein